MSSDDRDPGPATATNAATDPLQQALLEQAVIFEHAGVGIGIFQARVIVRCNQTFAEMFGYDNPLQMVGLSSIALHQDEATFKAFGRAAYPVMATGLHFREEFQMRRRNGQLFWVSASGKLIDPHNTTSGAVWIIDDISERKASESALKTVVTEQQLIFDNAMVGIVYLKDRQVTRCNRAFEALFGYGPGELQGSSSRQWYLSEEDWLQAGRDCYEPLAAGRTFAGDMLLRRKDGSPLYCEVRSKAIDSSNLAEGSIWITMDITARRQAQDALIRIQIDLERRVRERTEQLSSTVRELKLRMQEQLEAEIRIQRMAHFDALTGLPNRILLRDRCSQALSLAQRSSEPLAVMFLDLDHFKKVNDSLGHRVGDALLVALSHRLRETVRDPDTVSRLGGDEFVLVLPTTDAAGAAHLAEKLLRCVGQPFQIESHELTVTPSLGIAMFPADGADFDALCKCADAAMYQAKHDGRNAFRFYTAEMHARSDRNLQLENALRRALEREQLSLHYQPQVALASGRIIGAEALLRWQHPEFGAVSPAEFIPVAESSGLILPIGEWVLHTGCSQLKAWIDGGMAPITLSVNLSAVQFRHPDLSQMVGRMLDQVGLPAQYLELELTEGAAMLDPVAAVAVMDRLHQRGVRMSIDDFGTGYSSLSYLKRFRAHKLKIDQSFVRDLTDDPNDRAIVSAIISLANSLDMLTIAEGVETAGQLEFLQGRGCNEAQGYHISRPLPAAQFLEFVQRYDD